MHTAVQVQLSRLFGAGSSEAQKESRTPTEWRRTLRKALEELYRYTRENVETDELHWQMLLSCFVAAHESLKETDFWPGYTEALTRLTLLLLGDYPDHRKRKTGKKAADHYRLSRLRGLNYVQTSDQKLHVLLASEAAGFPELAFAPRAALREFREQHGYKPGYKDFLRWYKKAYPADYASIF
jgi:hypothetical protein